VRRMGLRLQFNLVLTVVFLLGLAVSGWVSYELLQKNARDEAVRTAQFMIETARSIRGYTVNQVRPELAPRLHEVFLPQTVPAYAASAVLSDLPGHTEYVYKEATLNPTNPIDRATDWEADLINVFRRDDSVDTLSGVRQTPTGPSLYIASPLKVGSEACLQCHSTPEAAPASMIAAYGSSNGFGWKLNEIIGAQVVSVPMAVALANANQAFITFMLSLCGVFLVLYIILNLMLSRMIVQPITRMSKLADQVSTGQMDMPELDESNRNEVGQLAAAFNRMRRSLEQAIKLIDA